MLKLCVISSLICTMVPAIIIIDGRLASQDDSSSIIFGNEKLKSLTLDSNVTESEIEEINTINVSIKLDYPEFEYVEDENVDSKQRKANLLAAGKAYYTQKNTELMDKIDTTNMENVYVSKYAPFLSFEMTPENFQKEYASLTSLADESYVDLICVDEEIQYEDKLYAVQNNTGIRSVVDKYSVTGEGITVGLLESGIVNKNMSIFKNSSITVRNEWYYTETITAHANRMASIITGEGGIAPNCHLLSVELAGDPTSEVEWMLDRNVDVVNCSFGYEADLGTYNNHSAYFDFIAYKYGVIFVVASGNNDTNTGDYVSNPGLGYNVITVGANICSGNNNSTCNFSCYKVKSGTPKPNFTAPGYMIATSGFDTTTSGTSPAAAITTASIALLLENFPEYIGYPQIVNAVLSASCDDILYGKFNTLDEYAGYGSLNLARAFETKVKLFPVKFGNLGFFPNIYAKEGQIIRACLSWLANADGNKNNTAYSKLKLCLNAQYASNIRDFYDESRNNAFIEYEIPSEENYALAPYGKVTIDTTAQVACAYYLYTPSSN